MKICQYWGREFISLSGKYEERVRGFSFLARHYFNAELYRYIIISLSLVKICWSYIVLYIVFLNPQCFVSQEDFQHKSEFSSSSCSYIQVGQERGSRNYENFL